MSLSKQEMFNLAWNGLMSQGFQRCYDDAERMCVYYDPVTGRRCAWGWVDPEGTEDVDMGGPGEPVEALYEWGVGLAKSLDPQGLAFAAELQAAHDGSLTPSDMACRLRRLAAAWGLKVPGEEVA